jgi:hypothetical protein
VRSREVIRVAVTGRVRVHGTGKLKVRRANGGVVYVIIKNGRDPSCAGRPSVQPHNDQSRAISQYSMPMTICA